MGYEHLSTWFFVNRNVCGYFDYKKGFRQGDLPVLPLIMKILGCLLQQGTADKVFSWHSRFKRTELTHLSFADDVLILTKGDPNLLGNLMVMVKHVTRGTLL